MTDLTFIAPAPAVPSDQELRMSAYLAAAEKSSGQVRAERPMRVMIESPFAGASHTAISLNQLYAREALRDSLLRGEAPMAAHVLYAQSFVLDQDDPGEREIIAMAGASWLPFIERVVVYVDRGITPAMEAGIGRARELGIEVEERSIPNWTRG